MPSEKIALKNTSSDLQAYILKQSLSRPADRQFFRITQFWNIFLQKT